MSVTLTGTTGVITVVGLLLICSVVWAAIFAADPARREAAQRVLAMLSRHKHIPTVPPALSGTQAQATSEAKRRRSRKR